MQEINFVYFIAILIMSVILHEISHGYAAKALGDQTAKLAGRLTLNPIPHIDPLGSIIVPVLLYFTTQGSFIFGWAKPVPYNPHNLRNQRWGTAFVGAAGVLTNLLIAAIFGLLIRADGALFNLPAGFADIIALIVIINVLLAVFNMIPIPPLDGSKVLFSLLPYHMRYVQTFLERYWPVFFVLVIFFGWRLIVPVLSYLFTLFTGIPI